MKSLFLPKSQRKIRDFPALPSTKLPGQKSLVFLVGILEESHSEFNWPLVTRCKQNTQQRKAACRPQYIRTRISYLKSSFILRTQLRDPHFFQKCCHFHQNQNKVSKNDNAFERNEDHVRNCILEMNEL